MLSRFLEPRRMHGYVLADVEVGREAEFFSALGSLPQVLHVYYLFDQYDNLFDPYAYLLEVRCDSVEELVQVMRRQIRSLPGVERTALFMERQIAEPPLAKRAGARKS